MGVLPSARRERAGARAEFERSTCKAADAFALPVNQDFGTSGWQRETITECKKYHLSGPAERPREARWGPAGFERLDAGSDPVKAAKAAARSGRRPKNSRF